MEPEEIKKLIDEINKAFEEFKKKNDQRLQEIEKGRQDPLLAGQVDKIAKEMQALSETKEALEKRLGEAETKLARPPLDPEKKAQDPAKEAKAAAILKYIRRGENSLTPEEVKLLASDSDPQGGYWVQSQMSNQVISKLFETSPMRNVATVETISGNALEVPDDLGEVDAGWTSERGSRSETATPTVGVRTITAHELYAMPKATQTLLDDARIDVESWLAGKIRDKISRTENAAFINGNGTGKPRGILTYPAGTTNPGQIQQVNSGDASLLTADGLRSVFYTLKSPYIQNARWLMARSTIAAISKLKGSDNNYLWQPGLQEGEPQRLLGHAVERMEDMPAVAANSLSIAFGDFRQGYTVVDRAGIRVLRDPFTAKPFVLFYTTKRTGGDVTNFEAFVIQKTAA